jgi:hypothetical protein
MRIHLLSIFAFAILAFATPARAYDPEFSKIVSYSKLMTLSPEKRAEYVRQVRLIVSEFEESQKNISGDSTAIADATERSLFLDMMVHEANAAVFLNTTPARRNAAWAQAFQGAYRCPTALTSRTKRINRRIRENGAQLMCLGYTFKGCPGGFHEIGGFGGKRVCYKPGLTDRQVAQRRAQQQKAKPGAQKKLASAKPATKRAPASRRAAENKRGNRPMPGNRSAEQLDGIGDADAVQDPDAGETTAEEDQHDINENLPEYRVLKDGETPVFRTENFKSAETEEFKCADEPTDQPPESCNDTTIAAARAPYFRDKAPHCIFAGNLRHYSNNQKRPGMCQHPHEFCFSNVACRKPDGSFVNKSEKPKVFCKDTKQILCNPLLFNLDENGDGLCVPPTRNATEACNQRADEVTSQYEATHGTGSYVPFISRLRIKSENDPNDQIALNGIKEAWDSFAESMNSICLQSPSKDLYCRECQIMKVRASKLNLLTFTKGVRDADGNCYKFDAIGIVPGKPESQATSPDGPSTNGGSSNAEQRN